MLNARKSHGNASSVFISPEGCRILAGGNTPGNGPDMWRPEGAPESPIDYPIRPLSRIRPIPHPKSTVDLGHEPLMRVENGLRTPLSPTAYKPIIRPENKGIKPKSNRHKPKNCPSLPLIQGENARHGIWHLFGVWRLVLGAFSIPSSILYLRFGIRCQALLGIAKHCQPAPPPLFFWLEGGRHAVATISAFLPSTFLAKLNK